MTTVLPGCSGGPPNGEEFSELHDLIDVENVPLEHPADRRIQRRQFLQPGLIDVGGRKLRQLALKIDMIGNLLGAVAQLVHQHDADRNLAFKLVARPDADQGRAAGAPFTVGIRIVGARLVRERHHVGCDVANRYGLSTTDYASTEAYFESMGLSVVYPSPDRLSLALSGAAPAVGRAFDTAIESGTYHGRTVTFPGTPPSLPVALQSSVSSVTGLSSGFDTYALPASLPVACSLPGERTGGGPRPHHSGDRPADLRPLGAVQPHRILGLGDRPGDRPAPLGRRLRPERPQYPSSRTSTPRVSPNRTSRPIPSTVRRLPRATPSMTRARARRS